MIDKSPGMTSHDVVGKVRRILKTKSVGHSGTLDPFASGLMVLLVGQATKISDYLRDGDKSYSLKVRWGSETDSLDRTGEVVRTESKQVDPEVLQSVALSAQGDLRLPIPLFSAKKINGKKLCEYARSGEAVEIPEKVMSFYGLQLEEVTSEFLTGEISCRSGGFIRSWAQHVGRESGALGYLDELRRTECCGYSIEQALTLENLQESLVDLEGIDCLNCFIPLSQALSHWPTVTIKGKDADLLRNGQVSHDLARRLNPEQRRAQAFGETIGVRVINGQTGQLLSLLEARPTSKLKIRRVFQVGAQATQ